MYYLVSKNRNVVGFSKQKKTNYAAVIAYFNELAEDKIRQVVDWSIVDESGHWYIKKDKNYVLRKYIMYPGYVYNSFHYEELADILVVHYDSEESAKKSYLDVLKKREVQANIKDIEKEGVKI
jgi:hypothetical protein